MIDGYATQTHYLWHLSQVWHALPPERRGTIYVGLNDTELAAAAARFDVPIARHTPPHGPDPVLVVAGADLAGAGQRPVVLLEHGAGQTYATIDSAAYSGGVGRDAVRLFLCPNETVAARNRARYPDATVVVVGAPTVPSGAPAPRSGRPVVAFSFHWNFQALPETLTAWPHWKTAVERHVRDSERSWLLVGHAHPKIERALRPWWRALDVPYLEWWPDVARAADVYVCDNSSTLYEFAAAGKPVVVLDAPWYRRDVDHGLRFWSHADVGVRIADPVDLSDAIRVALADPPVVRTERARIVADVFPHTGDVAARRAAEVILEQFA